MATVGEMVEGLFDLGQGQPWRERLSAWWEGTELAPEFDYITAETPTNEEGRDEDDDSVDIGRVEERMAAIQQIWGKGFEAPGTYEFAFELIHSLNLNKGQEVLQTGAGLGGTARALAEEYFVSVTSLVNSVEVARIAMAQTAEAGLDRKVRFAPFNPSQMGLRAGKYHCIFSREALFKIENKETFLDQAERALVPGGHLLLFDYTLPDEGETHSDVEAWAAAEETTPHMVPGKALVELLERRRFAVLTHEDVTDAYYRLILSGWTECLRTVKKMKVLGDLNDQFIMDLLDEAEIWGRRASILKDGHIRYHRIHAMKSLSN